MKLINSIRLVVNFDVAVAKMKIARRIEPHVHWYVTNEGGQWKVIREHEIR